MRTHPNISPFIVREPGSVDLVVPVLGRDGADVMRIALSKRAGALIARELAAAMCDQWADPIVRQPDDIEALSHECFVQTLDV